MAGTEYDIELTKDDVPCTIKIGGTTEKFVPNINTSKWNDECWLNINHPDVVNTEVEQFIDNKIELSIGNNTHRYYVNQNGRLEYEIVFRAKPTSNKVELDLDFSDGLSFFHQPALTQEEIDEGGERPDDVINSYAVYWKKKNNKYRTGKFCHIYRPKITDAAEHWEWCDLEYKDKKLTITISQNFLDSAVYPLTLDPTLGYTSIGGTVGGEDSRSYANRGLTFQNDIAILTGIVTRVWFYCRNTFVAEPVELGVYDESGGEPNNLLGSDSVNGSPSSWVSIDVSSGAWPITSGNDYYAACQAFAGPISAPVTYDTGLTGASLCYYTINPLPNPYGAHSHSSGVMLSNYFEYAAAGGTTYYQSVSGSLTPTGALSKTPGKALGGALSFSGGLLKKTSTALAGSLSFAGALIKKSFVALGGVISFAGSLGTALLKIISLGGTLTFSGSISKLPKKLLTGSISFTGGIVKKIFKSLVGTLDFAGAIAKTAGKQLGGALSFAGSLIALKLGTTYYKALTGTISFAGAISKNTKKILAGSLSFSGSIGKKISKMLSGALGFIGSLAKYLVGGVIKKRAYISFAPAGAEIVVQATGGIISFQKAGAIIIFE